MAYLLLLDFRKAFDLVSHSFIHRILNHIGLPDWVCLTVESLLTDLISVLAPPLGRGEIIVKSGIKQGCPLSPLIFIIVIDSLVHRLISVPGTLIRAFADDIGMVIDPNLPSPSYPDMLAHYSLHCTSLHTPLNQISNIIAEYCLASGSSINIDKSVLIPSFLPSNPSSSSRLDSPPLPCRRHRPVDCQPKAGSPPSQTDRQTKTASPPSPSNPRPDCKPKAESPPSSPAYIPDDNRLSPLSRAIAHACPSWSNLKCSAEGKYLGILFGPEITPLEVYGEATKKLLSRLARYQPLSQAFSRVQRIVLINVFIIPVISYLWNFFLPPHEVIVKTNGAIDKFIDPRKTIPRLVQMAHSTFTGIRQSRTNISLKAAAMLVAKLPDPKFPMPLIPTLARPTPDGGPKPIPDLASLVPNWNRGTYLVDPARGFIDYNRYQAAMFVHQTLPKWSGNKPCSVIYRDLLTCEDAFRSSFVEPLKKPLEKWLALLPPASNTLTPTALLETLSENLTKLPGPDSNARFQLQFFCNGLWTRSRAIYLGHANSTTCAFCGHSNDRLRSHLFNDCPYVLQAKKISADRLNTSWTLPLNPLDHAMLTLGDPCQDQEIRRRFILSCNQGVWSIYHDLLHLRNQEKTPDLPLPIVDAICMRFSALTPTRKRRRPPATYQDSRPKRRQSQTPSLFQAL